MFLRSLVPFCAMAACAVAQTTASLSGTVVDHTGAAVAAAQVRVVNVLNRFTEETSANSQGVFQARNLPFQTYEIHVSAPGFAPWTKVVALTSNVPKRLDIQLALAEAHDVLTVREQSSGAILVDPRQTGSYAQLNREDIERLPAPVGSRGLESALVTFPGFAQNANGAIHPRGAHNQMTYVIDGMPVSDQLTGAFANSIDSNMVQTMEMFTGNIPAEFGNKVAAVVNITTKSGLGSSRPAGGSVLLSGAGADTVATVVQAYGELGRVGYSASANLLKTHRYLDPVSFDDQHNGGNSQRAFLRLDWAASARDSIRLTALSGRSSFQLANLRSQQAAGMDQRQLLEDTSASAGWIRVLDAATTWDVTASLRSSWAKLFDSAGDTPVTARQSRKLTTGYLGARITHLHGGHQIRTGFEINHFPVREAFRFAITDIAFNAPGSMGYVETLGAFDLTRGGVPFEFSETNAGTLISSFFQDNATVGPVQLALGIRYDNYRFLSRAAAWQPRLGLSYNLKPLDLILRMSYNRTFQPPPNENLLISNSSTAAVLVPPTARAALGGAFALIQPERQNFYEIGLQRSFRRLVAINVAYYHKDGRGQQDNNAFFNTPIIFPTSLARIRVNAVEGRLIFPEHRGLSGTVSLTHYHAVSTPPFTGGLFLGNSAVDALSQGPFVIDHDQKLAVHGVVNYSNSNGFFSTLSIRHDSGLVVNAADPKEVRADPDYTDLLPYVDLNGAPPRARARTVADAMAGVRFSKEHRRGWEVSGQITNMTNVRALYNFQSLFVGTRLVAPRTVGARVRFFF